MLGILIPFWSKFVNKNSKKISGRGLGITVSTLTGKKSESILKQFIGDRSEYRIIHVSNDIERIVRRSHYLRQREKERKDMKRLGMKVVKRQPEKLANVSLEHYVKDYRYWAGREALFRMKLDDLFQTRPYRNNPFIT